MARSICSAIIGAAGEHLVMGELLRRGHIAALAPQGAPNMDILIADRSGERLCGIQVKTRSTFGGDGGWPLNQRHETILGSRLFYVFVDLAKPEGEAPDYYVIPASVVAKVVRETHLAWERNPGRDGRQRSKNNPMRRIRPDYSAVYTAEPAKYVAGWMEVYKGAWSHFQQLAP